MHCQLVMHAAIATPVEIFLSILLYEVGAVFHMRSSLRRTPSYLIYIAYPCASATFAPLGNVTKEYTTKANPADCGGILGMPSNHHT